MHITNPSPQFYPRSRNEWRNWLAKNHALEKKVWLLLYNQGSGKLNMRYEEAVEEALCFGWIDSTPMKHDEHSRFQSFSPRKPKSNWSKVNKARVAELTKAGLMTPAGTAMVDLAKQTGTWDAMNEVEELIVPDDLINVLKQDKAAYVNFIAFAPSARKVILTWIATAKRPETRKKRIEETVAKAAQNKKAHTA